MKRTYKIQVVDKEWIANLKRPGWQRDLYRSNVNKFINHIKNNNFHQSLITISKKDNGYEILLDGQHKMEAIKRVKDKVKDKTIEIEVENEKDAITAAKLGVDVIMLDNFEPKSGEIVAKKIREINPDILIEISGGVNPDNIKNYASFADRISLGYLTYSVKSKDCSLEILGNV